ncbi:MAG: OmpH family outer membrane protein [Planctomycetaceae bacterium]|nr:OmpH family outer membrane protein [Planctomycetaceae bacterium]
MKKSLSWAAPLAVVLSLCGLVSPVAAQNRPAAGPNVALLDVSYIFKNHARFKAMMEEMKADVERAEVQVKGERDTINKLVERLQEIHKGTPDYKQMEQEIAKRQADLAVRVNLQKNEFVQREAKIYYTVYQEISQATDYYARQNGIDMVLRFNGDPVDTEQPQSVLAHINKPVVWYQKQLDITPAVLQELNRNAINPGQAARPGVPFNGMR